jgi:hypothetical protein
MIDSGLVEVSATMDMYLRTYVHIRTFANICMAYTVYAYTVYDICDICMTFKFT